MVQENPGKIAIVPITAHRCDIFQGKTGMHKQILGPIDPYLGKPCDHIHTAGWSEQMPQIMMADADMFRHILHALDLGKMDLDIAFRPIHNCLAE